MNGGQDSTLDPLREPAKAKAAAGHVLAVRDFTQYKEIIQ